MMLGTMTKPNWTDALFELGNAVFAGVCLTNSFDLLNCIGGLRIRQLESVVVTSEQGIRI